MALRVLWQGACPCLLLAGSMLAGCMSTRLALGDAVKSPVVIGGRMQIGAPNFQQSAPQQVFESSAQRQFVVAGSQSGSGWRDEWQNDLVRKANWALQGSARRAIKDCEITSTGSMLNLFFLIGDRQRTEIHGEVVEIERPDDTLEDEGSGDDRDRLRGEQQHVKEEVSDEPPTK